MRWPPTLAGEQAASPLLPYREPSNDDFAMPTRRETAVAKMTEDADTRARAAEERPPLGGWGRLYAIVLGELALLVLLFTLFARAFS